MDPLTSEADELDTHPHSAPSCKRLAAAAASSRMSRFAVKSTWTMEEDAKLCELTQEVGVKQWSLIARSLPGRTGKQVRACAVVVCWCADAND